MYTFFFDSDRRFDKRKDDNNDRVDSSITIYSDVA